MTTYTVTTDAEFTQFVAPRLLAAPVEYDQRFMDQYTNVLRLYFNQLDNILGQLQATVVTTPADNNGTAIWLSNSGGFFSG